MTVVDLLVAPIGAAIALFAIQNINPFVVASSSPRPTPCKGEGVNARNGQLPNGGVDAPEAPLGAEGRTAKPTSITFKRAQ